MSMAFPPAGSAPREVRTDRVLLRPLRAADAERDYDAVMSDAAGLRRSRESEWPRDGFTLAENRADLERHERDHESGEAFTYTVLALDEARCLGCIYIVPVWDEAVGLCGAAACGACVGFWIRASERTTDLDRHLLTALRGWLGTKWPLDCVLFTCFAADERQIALFEESGLPRFPLLWPDGRAGWVFRMERSATTGRAKRKALVREYLETSRPAGVYRICNTRSGRSLVGASDNLPAILHRQRFQLENGSHPDRELQADWRDLGPDAFAFETLDLLKPSEDPSYDPTGDLRALEEMWLEKLAEAGVSFYRRSRPIP